MRDFSELQRVLPLRRIVAGRHYSRYVSVPVPGRPTLAVERFEGEIAASLLPKYVALLHGLQAWLDARPELARWVRVEQPSEIGPDYVVRPHHVYIVSTASYDNPELGVETPPEYEPMREATLRALRSGPGDLPQQRFEVVARVLTRSLLEPSYFTYFNDGEDRFIVVVPSFEEQDLRQW